MRRWTTGLLALLVALSFSAPAFAQLEQGRLTGFVTDGQGAALPGVTVTATSPALLGANTAITEVDGRYLFPSLPSGRYQLKFELSGFQTDDSREHRARTRTDAQRRTCRCRSPRCRKRSRSRPSRRSSTSRRRESARTSAARSSWASHRRPICGRRSRRPPASGCWASTPAAATRASRPDTRASAFAIRTASSPTAWTRPKVPAAPASIRTSSRTKKSPSARPVPTCR